MLINYINLLDPGDLSSKDLSDMVSPTTDVDTTVRLRPSASLPAARTETKVNFVFENSDNTATRSSVEVNKRGLKLRAMCVHTYTHIYIYVYVCSWFLHTYRYPSIDKLFPHLPGEGC